MLAPIGSRAERGVSRSVRDASSGRATRGREIDGEVCPDLTEAPALQRQQKHDIEVVVAKFQSKGNGSTKNRRRGQRSLEDGREHADRQFPGMKAKRSESVRSRSKRRSRSAGRKRNEEAEHGDLI